MHDARRTDQEDVGAAGVPPGVLKAILGPILRKVGRRGGMLVLFVIACIVVAAIVSYSVQHVVPPS